MTLSNSLVAELDKLATACRILAMEGHNDISLGHLSLRDPDGRGLWLKRFYLGLDEIMSADDFILIDFDGKQLDGAGERHAEWPIHAEIIRARSDVNIVAHGHPFYASLLAATGQPLLPVGQEGIHVAGNTPYYKDTSDLINTPQLGRDLAATLGDAQMVFMKNHGITYCGKTIAETTILGI
ncbi:MAG: class II aldolase/adducin family protein, partial [Rhodospirillales bacterium]|nr:class II aldolase/adducin family protein [Rhodospirillales bacterium]